MTNPRTRLDEATNDFERDLLGAWDGEQPSKKARDRALAAVTGGALLATTTTATATTTGVFLKLGVTAVLALAVTGGVVLAQRGGEVAQGHGESALPNAAGPQNAGESALPNAAGPQNAGESALPKAAPPSATGLPSAGDLALPNGAVENAPPIANTAVVGKDPPVANTAAARSAPVANTAAGRSAPAATLQNAGESALPNAAPGGGATIGRADPGSAAPDPTAGAEVAPKTRALGEQVALIDAARAALARGDAATALGRLDEYDARFPAGSLAQEAILLRVDALLRSGRRAEATALADRAIAANSPYSAKLRGLIGGKQP